MARCEMCGVDVTFDLTQHYVPDFDGKKHRVCKNCVERAKDKALKYDPATDRVIIVEKSEIEIRKKCNVCGNMFCYNPVDVDNNKRRQGAAILYGLGGYAAAAAVQQNSVITDYNKCPQCGSNDLRVISKEELSAEMNYRQPQQTSTPPISVADELKKYKELLDMGVITQDEFDAKKKELLNGAAPAVQPVQQPVPTPPPAPAPQVQTYQTAPVYAEQKKNNSNLPNILFWVIVVLGLVNAYREVYISSFAFTRVYRGALSFIVGSEAYVSAILAGVIWVALTFGVAIAVKKIAASKQK